jgi:hypothetical protein
MTAQMGTVISPPGSPARAAEMSIAQRTSLAAAKAARAVRNSRGNLLRRFRLRRCVCALTVISIVCIAAPPQAVFAARVCRAAAFAATSCV